MSYTRRKKQQHLQTAFTANTASQYISDSVLDISNSEISFTPPAGNFEYVVYEYTIQYHHDNDANTILCYELREKIGSGEYSRLVGGYKGREQALGQRFQSTMSGRFFIPIYSGTRTYKMTIRAISEVSEGTLHVSRTPHIYSPIYQMYCI